ncbi:hypothetical protein [Bradyrhizobium sp. HKCCYLS20291]|uniref:hypothetical protein n=1 Tax=Bradyrhizobium sp. HKCCYLS20291 TaxID=3420766 RepID=UPI003EB90AE6
MPSKDQINRVVASNPLDLKNVRIPGLTKPFEQLTVSELVQLRPGSAVADTWEVNAVTDNVSATTSAALAALGKIQADRAVSQVINQSKLNTIRTQLGAQVQGFSADAPSANDVQLGTDDVFRAGGSDPFKA